MGGGRGRWGWNYTSISIGGWLGGSRKGDCLSIWGNLLCVFFGPQTGVGVAEVTFAQGYGSLGSTSLPADRKLSRLWVFQDDYIQSRWLMLVIFGQGEKQEEGLRGRVLGRGVGLGTTTTGYLIWLKSLLMSRCLGSNCAWISRWVVLQSSKCLRIHSVQYINVYIYGYAFIFIYIHIWLYIFVYIFTHVYLQVTLPMFAYILMRLLAKLVKP